MIGYRIDCMMSKGAVAMTVLLFAITATIVVFIGILASFISKGNFFHEVWNSLMYTLDAGNLAGVSTDNLIYLLLMFLATLCGLFLTSVLIGVIATGVEEKLGELRKGKVAVLENDHTVIIGFDSNVYTIVKELIEANSNKKNKCIVILGEQPKEEMEEAINSHIPNSVTTKIICRSGRLHENYALERCSIETCKSVIVNVDDDAETVKILLALATYIKGKELTNPELKFVASMKDKQYIEAASIAGEGRAAIIYAKDAIARIISNTCRQHGLSQVLTELFNFSGDELYFEKVPELVEKTFKEAIMSFSIAIAIGIAADGRVTLNPPMETVIGNNDEIVLLEADDGEYKYHSAKKVDESKICNSERIAATADSHLIVLGSNEKLNIILEEYSKYVESGTHVVIVDDDVEEDKLGKYENLDIELHTEAITREVLSGFINKDADNILLLNDDSNDPETSDSQTLLRLILLRDIADSVGLDFAITTEMRSVDNQRLASRARVDDFVIGSNYASLIMAQVSENPQILPLIDDLLDESGSELYMKPVSDYVTLGVPVDSYILSESAARKGEVCLGYRLNSVGKSEVVVNPLKTETVIFGESDQIAVVAEN